MPTQTSTGQSEGWNNYSQSDTVFPRHPSTAPPDRLRLVYVIFYLLGIGTLLPWNFFSNAKTYFMYKLRNVTLDAEDAPTGEYVYNASTATELQVMFESYLSLAAMVPGVLFMFINTAAVKLVRMRVRMLGAGVVMIIMFGLTIALVKIDSSDWQVQFFAVSLVTVIIMNAGSAILQGGIFGLSSMFPQSYTQSVMGGMGLGGTLAAVANILIIYLTDNAIEMGFIYFMTAEVVILTALIGYILLPYTKFARYHTEKARKLSESSISVSVNTDSEEAPLLGSNKSGIVSPEYLSLWGVFTRLWWYGLTVCGIFCVTLSCYPAVNSSIQSIHIGSVKSPWVDTYFAPVTCFLIFNAGDLFGRTLAGFLKWPGEGSKMLPLIAVLRIGFIPMFMLCNVQPRNHLPVFFHHDAYPIVFMALFAISNGHLGTLCMMYGPRRVPELDIETAGAMMSFFLSLGLALGSCLSFGLIVLV